MTKLRKPTPAELRRIWNCRSIYPMQSDEAYYMKSELYRHLGLDWRTPAHKAHVEAIVADHMPVPSRILAVRETND